MRIDPIDITCPTCGELARFEEPFEFVSGTAPNEDSRPVHQWGGWFVIERFPSMVSWRPPSGTSSQYLRWGGGEGPGYPLLTNGVVQCSSCHANKKHTLAWPDDAYWQWEIRGQVLWAWDKSHAERILNFVTATTRPARRAPDLRYIPTHFLTAKVRSEEQRKMTVDLDG